MNLLSESPKIYTINNFLTKNECEHFINISKYKMQKALVSGDTTGVISNGRTGKNCWVQHNFDAITKNIAEKISKLVKIPLENAESYQIIYYDLNGEYRQHYDGWLFDNSEKSLRNMKYGGQRLMTALVYLNDVESGGGTKFTKLNLEVNSEKGKLLVFENVHAGTNLRHELSQHAGMPVLKGEKWAFNLWFREASREKLYDFEKSNSVLESKIQDNMKISNNNINSIEIKVSSNKNNKIFDKAKQLALNNLCHLSLNGIYGIEYNDYDANMAVINEWKQKYKNIKLYIISCLKKTTSLDDKITFCKRMCNSKYLPECFYSYNEIPISTNTNEIFFVKSRGTTNAAGVNVYLYKDLLNVNMKNCVIQKSMKNPDLYQNKRYKIRIHAVIFNKNFYCYNKYFGNVSKIEYDNCNLNSVSEKFKKMHIMYQDTAPHYILNSDISENNIILDNIILALKDVKNNFFKEINLFNENEFVLLGVDVVVDSDKNIQIIEINHRSNYQHGDYITSNIDIPSIKDLIILLITGNTNNYILI